MGKRYKVWAGIDVLNDFIYCLGLDGYLDR